MLKAFVVYAIYVNDKMHRLSNVETWGWALRFLSNGSCNFQSILYVLQIYKFLAVQLHLPYPTFCAYYPWNIKKLKLSRLSMASCTAVFDSNGKVLHEWTASSQVFYGALLCAEVRFGSPVAGLNSFLHMLFPHRIESLKCQNNLTDSLTWSNNASSKRPWEVA